MRGRHDGQGEGGGREGPRRVGPSLGQEGWGSGGPRSGWQGQEVHSGIGAQGVVSVCGQQLLVIPRPRD